MWAWLNPKNLIQVLTLVKTIWDSVMLLYVAVNEWLVKRRQKKEISKVEEAVDDLKEANKIEDDNERLKKKAEAACKIEQSFNPTTDCYNHISKQ